MAQATSTLTLVILGIVNILIVILVSPFYEGCIRKLKAIVHSRKGPPIRQPYYDLLKLLGKEDLRVAPTFLIQLAPIVCFACILLISLLAPLGASPPLGFYGDVIAIIYFAGLAGVAVMIGAMSTENPYSFVGMSREMMMTLSVEPIMAISLIIAAINAQSFKLADIVNYYYHHGPSISMVIAAIPFFLILQAQLGKLPFDIAEADQEIMGGPFIEASGPRLALFKWSFYAKQIVFVSIFMELFIPWPKTGLIPIDILINLAKVFIAVIIVGLIDVVNPRIRIDQSIRFYWGTLVFSLVALAFAVIGV